MPKVQEMVLYYQAVEEKDEQKGRQKEKEKNVRLMKSVLVRMGVRIKNIGPKQVLEQVGWLAGVEGFSASEMTGQEELPVILQDVLVMKNFTSERIDRLLAELRKAGVPKIALKAIVTPQNVSWNFYTLYQELIREHEAMKE